MIGAFVQLNLGSHMARTHPIGYIVCENGCWEWVGSGDRYGSWRGPNGKSAGAHRILFERAYGPIPSGLQIDHLCRNTKCVRPDHMEAVTPRVNTLRSSGIPAINAARTVCQRGHPFNDENTYREPGTAYRQCQVCRRAAHQRRKARGRPKRKLATAEWEAP